ncbi:hypothetical protein CLV30_13216 [Haloactinopolyspora alba]|uniref:Uncharacterized protein n=1 Tax=Haloactinopolyspora alba TaxID=648780 RepID=A0A2P8D5A6_9ACTN|nr:hypothetical protein [Haloactinopolyspora alba]PSK92400.1 hypothetical protein CLV30_13216 [Haloactinopolyspora alba]
MSNWRARARLWAFACVTGMVLTGCGSDGDGGTATGSGDGDDGSGERVAPLSEYMGEGFELQPGGMMSVTAVGANELTDEQKQQMRQVEEKVAQCMRDRGFDYVPASPESEGESEFEKAYSLDPADFAAEYGYGITTLDRGSGDDGDSKDPNQKIREELSASARKAYDKALWGEDVQVLEDGGGVAIRATPGGDGGSGTGQQGCRMKASEQVRGDSGPRMGGPGAGEFEGLFQDIASLTERINSDPRVVEAQQGWSDCMAAAGHDGFEVPSDARKAVMDRAADVPGLGMTMPTGPGSGSPDDGSAESSAEQDVDEAEIEKIREYEIDVATADHECKQQGYQETYDEVSHELQEEFVEQHRAELERYRDSRANANQSAGQAGAAG